MKNVLLTTTALVAFAGAAAADSSLSLSGSASATYNVEAATTALVASATVGASYSATLNNGMVATLSAGDVLSYDGADWTLSGSAFTASLATSYGTLSFGDVENAGYDGDGDSTLSLVSGMSEGVAAADAAHDVRIDAAMGGFSAELSFASGAAGNNAIAVSGNAAGADVAFATDGDQSAMTGAISFGGADVDVAYASDGTNTSVGVAVSYALTGGVTVSGSAASNSAADDEQAFKLAYASGNLEADISYDVDADTYAVNSTYTTTLDAVAVELTMGYDGSDVSISVDATYTAGDLTVLIGASDSGNAYLDASYDLGGGASAFASYANADDLGPNDVDTGTFVGVSLDF
jgi:hypothetical protein